MGYEIPNENYCPNHKRECVRSYEEGSVISLLNELAFGKRSRGSAMNLSSYRLQS